MTRGAPDLAFETREPLPPASTGPKLPQNTGHRSNKAPSYRPLAIGYWLSAVVNPKTPRPAPKPMKPNAFPPPLLLQIISPSRRILLT